MLTNSRNTIVRLGILAIVVALALTAAYYYGVARAQSVVALPISISLNGQGGAATAQPAAATQRTATTLATATTAPAATAQPVTTALPTTTRATSPPTAPSTASTANTPSTEPSASAPSVTQPPSTTATTSPTPSTSTPTNRQVVTPIRGWDCEPHSGAAAPAGGGSTGTTDCP